MDDIKPVQKPQAETTAKQTTNTPSTSGTGLRDAAQKTVLSTQKKPKSPKNNGKLKWLIALVLVAALVGLLIWLGRDQQGEVVNVRSDTVKVDTIRLSLARDESGQELEVREIKVGQRGFGKIEFTNPEEGTKVYYRILGDDGVVIVDKSTEFPLQVEKDSQLFGIPAIEETGTYTIEMYHQSGTLLDTLDFKVLNPVNVEPNQQPEEDSDEQAQESAPEEQPQEEQQDEQPPEENPEDNGGEENQ